MPIIDSLGVESFVDPREFTRGIDATVAAVEAGARRMEAAASGVELFGGATVGGGATSALASLRAETEALAALARTVDFADPEDVATLQALADEQRAVAQATDGAHQQLRQLDGVLDEIYRSTNGLRQAQQRWLADAKHGSVEAQANWQRQRMALREAEAAQQRQASAATRAAAQEVAARKLVQQQLVGDIRELALYGRTVDATNARAVAAWREEAAAIRQQATEVGLARRQMLQLEATIQGTERAFTRQAAAAQRAAQQGRAAASGAIGPMGALGGIVHQTTGRFDRFGQRGANAAIAVAFGLEAVARGGSAAESGIRTAARAAASFAAMFGPKGLLVSGVIASGVAISELFERTRKEMEQTRKKFEEELGRMVRSGDFVGLQKAARDLFVGDPARGIDPISGFFKPGVDAETGKITSGLGALRAEFARLDAQRRAFGPLLMNQDDRKRLEEITPQLEELERQWVTLTTALRNPPPLPRELTGLPPITIEGKTPARAMSEAIKAMTEAADKAVFRLNLALDTSLPTTDIQPLLDDVLAQHARVTAEIARQGGVHRANVELLKTQAELAERLALGVAIKLPDLKQLLPDPDRLVDLGPAKAFEEAKARVDAATAAAARFNDQLDSIGDGSRGVLQVADAFGEVDDAIRRGVDGLGGLLSGVAAYRKARDAAIAADPFNVDSGGLGDMLTSLQGLGAIAGIIGGAVSFVGGLVDQLLGEGERSREAREITEKNNDLLADLAAELRGWVNSVGSITTTIERLSGIDDFSAFAKESTAPFASGAQEVGHLNQRLAAFGVTFEELNRVAEANGIQLLDSKGRLVAEAFDQMLPILEATRERLLSFGTSFDGMSARLDFRAEIFDLEGPVEDFTRSFQVLDSVAPAIADQIRGFDVNTEAGRAAIEQMFRDWASMTDEQRVEFLKNTEFESGDQFNDTISQMDRAMDDLRETTEGAIASLTNVPAGFKVALRRFEATALDPRPFPVVDSDGFQLPVPTLPPDRPANLSVRSQESDLRALVAALEARGGDTYQITIQGANKTAEQLLDEINVAARRRARARGGSSAPITLGLG